MSLVSETFLTPAEAGERLGISGRTIRRWVEAGHISGVILPSGMYRVPESAVESIEADHAEAAS